MDNLDIWEKIFRNKEWDKYPPIPLIKFIAKNFYNVPDRKNIKILEIGSGPGANIWYMAREGFTVYGIDGSKTACENAKKKLLNDNLKNNIGSIATGDYHNLLNNFENGYFDAIIDVESLYCNSLTKSKEIIELAFKKLKSNGVFYSQTFANGTWGFDGDLDKDSGLYPIEGPLANTGFVRPVTKENITDLYKLENNSITLIERVDQLLQNKKVIKEWIIELKKK